MRTYTVEVAREDDQWIADVVDVPGAHTHAHDLQALHRNIQEVIGLVLDRPEGERFDVQLVFNDVDEAFTAAKDVDDGSVELARRQTELADRTVAAAQRLADEGWSVRDIGDALQLTPGRVSQIITAKRVG